MSGDSDSVSRILRESPPDDRRAVDRVFSLVYDELRRMAHAQLARGPSGQTMSTTVLIHQAYLRLAVQTGARFPDRAHFYGYAARVMRSILVDHARSRGAGKRGGGLQSVPLDECDLPLDTHAELVVGIDDPSPDLPRSMSGSRASSSAASSAALPRSRRRPCLASPNGPSGATGSRRGPGCTPS